MINIGILAHVDAGKTTLSENILYQCNVIRSMGRVDNKDTCLDFHALEKQRGITIFSSCAAFETGGRRFTLVDTPGHTDFSAETERTLSVLDCCILLVSAPEGIQGHTATLWKLLDRYRIPAMIFVNKMDQYQAGEEDILDLLHKKLSSAILRPDDKEEISLCSEKMLDEYLETGDISDKSMQEAVSSRLLFPVCFGSALRSQGIDRLLDCLGRFTREKSYPEVFSARVYKISHDDRHNRLTHLKVTGGTLKTKDRLGEEKINEIRIYTGESFKTVPEVCAGEICAVTGLSSARPGQGIGCADAPHPYLEPVMNYRIIFDPGISPVVMMNCLKEIAEESPELQFVWDEKTEEIHVRVMGVIQLEILKSLVRERYGHDIDFGAGSIVYKETVAGTVEGVGHFEPLRHYAEVHLLVEPGPRGSGVTCAADLSEDILSGNWQRLILTHIMEKTHKGVLTGSDLTDVKITLKAGRAHVKHTEGGDFRQAVYRAVRQALMQAESVLLEPYYDFTITLPQECAGRAMNDIDMRSGKCSYPENEDGMTILTGYAPVSEMWDYYTELTAYTGGRGHISLAMRGYDICHNAENVLDNCTYDPDADLNNPSGSVFCEHGSGVFIPWYEVPQYMHVESVLGIRRDSEGVPVTAIRTKSSDQWLDSEEVDAILKKVSGANSKIKSAPVKKVYSNDRSSSPRKPVPPKPRYMLIDGYNIIFAWEDLRELARHNVDSARLKLEDIISNYAGYTQIETAVVYDAYRLENHRTEIYDSHNIHVVFTATAETADHYIERFTNEHASKYDITVATSDGVEQIIIRSQGCRLLSAAMLMEEIKAADAGITEIIHGSI